MQVRENKASVSQLLVQVLRWHEHVDDAFAIKIEDGSLHTVVIWLKRLGNQTSRYYLVEYQHCWLESKNQYLGGEILKFRVTLC